MKIAVVPGDGIGKEVIPAGLRVPQAAAAAIQAACAAAAAEEKHRTRDLGGQATTAQVTDAVCAILANG